MARSKNSLTAVIIVALALVLLFVLNPTTADFQAWRSAQAESQASGGKTSGLIGVLKTGAGKIAGAMTGAIAGGYKRSDYYFCSTYALGGDTYLGIARLFIKVK